MATTLTDFLTPDVFKIKIKATVSGLSTFSESYERINGFGALTDALPVHTTTLKIT